MICEETRQAFSPSLLQGLFLAGGGEMDVGAHRTGDLAHRRGLRGPQQPLAVALHLLVPDQELAAEGDGLGVDAVGAADGRQVLVGEGLFQQDFFQRLAILARTTASDSWMSSDRAVSTTS